MRPQLFVFCILAISRYHFSPFYTVNEIRVENNSSELLINCGGGLIEIGDPV